MSTACRLKWKCFSFVVFVAVATSSWSPKYVWPLGDTSVYREVMEGRDGHLPVSCQCFVFSDGYPGLPYRSLTLREQDNSFVDFYLNGKEEFRDLAISLYIYALGEPEGTIFNYMCETGNIIKLAVMQGMLFVSFWDEFGVSVGATAVSELLVADTWSHLLVSREFETGRIKVFHNGEVVDNIDDDFPNKIRLPIKGSIRLGSSQKDKNEKPFNGRFACFQFYTSTPDDNQVKTSTNFCMPDRWKIFPKVNLETRMMDGEKKDCVTDYVPPRDVDVDHTQCDVIDMSCLSSGVNWNLVLLKHQWTHRKRDSAYFHLIGREHIPVQNGDTIFGNTMTTDKMVCSRVCLRVDGCLGFSSTYQSSNTTRCVLYNNVMTTSQFEAGAMFFSLV